MNKRARETGGKIEQKEKYRNMYRRIQEERMKEMFKGIRKDQMKRRIKSIQEGNKDRDQENTDKVKIKKNTVEGKEIKAEKEIRRNNESPNHYSFFE